MFGWIANLVGQRRPLPRKSPRICNLANSEPKTELRDQPFRLLTEDERIADNTASARQKLKTDRKEGKFRRGLDYPVVLRQHAIWSDERNAFEIHDMPVADNAEAMFMACSYGLWLMEWEIPRSSFDAPLSDGRAELVVFEIDYGTRLEVLATRLLECMSSPVLVEMPLTHEIVPLLGGQANAVRADTKRIDACRLGAAPVFSAGPVYERLRQPGEMHLVNAVDAWVAAIETLVADPARRRMAAAANSKAVERMAQEPPSNLEEYCRSGLEAEVLA